jgi:hypothetical protein
MRQLYLYSIAVKEKYGEFPGRLFINSYRNQTIIEEVFDNKALEKTEAWAERKIQEITAEKEWRPNLDWFRCKYLCGYASNCEYYHLWA